MRSTKRETQTDEAVSKVISKRLSVDQTLPPNPPLSLLHEEKLALEQGYRCLAGIDEAGRGALAGPVVAACVVLPQDRYPQGVADSKTLTPDQRNRLYTEIIAMARGVGVGIVEATVIDSINILKATHQAMRMALANLPAGLFPDVALIDGLPVRPFPIDQIAIVQGDSRSATIAAASIIAKVTRDRLMCDHASSYPDYGFESHKGYGAPLHIAALQTHGPCPLHRRSFRPVAASLPEATLFDITENRENRENRENIKKPFDAETNGAISPEIQKAGKTARPGTNRKQLGIRGEALVAQHLSAQGWKILRQNYRCPQGEIDLIAQTTNEEGNILVFVEVKTRHGRRYGSACEAVDARKRQKLLAVAQFYLGELQAGGEEPALRFDVAEVYIAPNDFATIQLHPSFVTTD